MGSRKQHSWCRLNSAAVKARMHHLGMSQEELVERAGISKRALSYWLAGERKLKVEDAETIAEVLGVGLDGVAIDVEAAEREHAEASSEQLSKASRDDREGSIFLQVVLRHWQKYRWYSRHIGLRWWPLRGYVRAFSHDKRHGNGCYAEVVIRPRGATLPAPDRVVRFTLSFCLSPARIDYGYLDVHPDGRVTTMFVFGTPSVRGDQEGRVADGCVTFWTWFGRETCRFMARSTDFDFTIDGPKYVAASLEAMPEHAAAFPAAAHHLAAEL